MFSFHFELMLRLVVTWRKRWQSCRHMKTKKFGLRIPIWLVFVSMHQRSKHVWKTKLQKLLFSLGLRLCVKQHFHAWCTWSQSIETDSLTLICKTTWLLQLPDMSHASESLLCEPFTHLFWQTDLGETGFIISLRFFQIISILVSFWRLVWSFNF